MLPGQGRIGSIAQSILDYERERNDKRAQEARGEERRHGERLAVWKESDAGRYLRSKYLNNPARPGTTPSAVDGGASHLLRASRGGLAPSTSRSSRETPRWTPPTMASRGRTRPPLQAEAEEDDSVVIQEEHVDDPVCVQGHSPKAGSPHPMDRARSAGPTRRVYQGAGATVSAGSRAATANPNARGPQRFTPADSATPPPRQAEACEPPARKAYSIKYFGVAHGQLGVLTRRKSLARSARQLGEPPSVPASRPSHAGASLAPGHHRPVSAAPASVTRQLSRETLPRPESAQAQPTMAQFVGGGRARAGGAASAATSKPRRSGNNASFRLDPALRLVARASAERDDNSLAVADFDIVNAVEDYSGSVWLPTNAVMGKGLRQMRRPESCRNQYKEDDRLGPPSGYIPHTALMGWKLSPGFAKPGYSPIVASQTHQQKRAQSAGRIQTTSRPPHFGYA
eukprot:CAMPEP_0114230226 /NCGR_PEP_ID=MMETSP0058-20121206/3352_1 /TAXON_ID=36894 /ORGANISM="Pyramimonas parkeae, CCMP726" /LENGTH=455 /DNA_ID=CAMNT_0001341403 /DNA_START=219 /DNA_END=1586 /DNA_ORIENTATION=-